MKIAIEIVDLPIKSMVIFHSYVNVYQRVEPVAKMIIIVIWIYPIVRIPWLCLVGDFLFFQWKIHHWGIYSEYV